MSRKKAAFLAVFVFFLLLCSCNEMDSILSPSRMFQMYQVSARGETYTLDECALIKQDEQIRPYFTQSVRDDPEVNGLTVLLRTTAGVETGRQVRYLLGSDDNFGSDYFDDSFDSDYSDYSDDDSDLIIYMERISRSFPVFTMPMGLKPGPYVMVFEVYGKRETVISRTEKNIYYLGEEDYSVTNLTVHLPGTTAPPHLIPPGTTALLNAEVLASEALDPYIVWYNGSSRIGEGRVSEGANQILYKLPSRTSFQNIRAELLPFPPVSRNDSSYLVLTKPSRVFLGESMEIFLAVSPDAKLTTVLSGFLNLLETNHQANVLRDYRLAGDLNDSKNLLSANTLKLVTDDEDDEILPRWFPSGDVYGLGIGPENIYELPSFSFNPIEEQLLFLLRFMPLNTGTLFSVNFENNEIKLDYSLEEERFLLKILADATEEQFRMEIAASDDLITLSLNLSLRHDDLLVALGQGRDLTPIAEKTIKLYDTEIIQGSFRLGSNQSDNTQVSIDNYFDDIQTWVDDSQSWDGNSLSSDDDSQYRDDSNLYDIEYEDESRHFNTSSYVNNRFPVMILNGLSMLSLPPVEDDETVDEE